MIIELTGDATIPHEPGPLIIAHVVNDRGGWGAGFSGALARRWPSTEVLYRDWHRGVYKGFTHGSVMHVRIGDNLTVTHMLAQRGYKTRKNPHPLSIEDLDECLEKLMREARRQDATVQMPRIGAGLGGGDWDSIRALIKRHADPADRAVIICALPPAGPGTKDAK